MVHATLIASMPEGVGNAREPTGRFGQRTRGPFPVCARRALPGHSRTAHVAARILVSIQAVQTVVPASQRTYGLSPIWSDEEVQLRWFAPLRLAQAATLEGAVASAAGGEAGTGVGIGGEPVAPLLIQSAQHLLQQLAAASVRAAARRTIHAGLAPELTCLPGRIMRRVSASQPC